MNHKFNVLLKEVRAAMLFASTDESRYVLNSVHFDVNPGRAPILVSTDGRRLCVIESSAIQDEKEPIEAACSVSISAAFLKPLLSFANRQLLSILPLRIEYHPSTRVIFHLVGCVVDAEKGAVIDMPFPNWRQVIPVGGEKEPMSELGLNADLVADFAKAAKLLETKPSLRMNLFREGGAIEAHLSAMPNFYAVIMPLRSDSPVAIWQPEFLSISQPKAA